MRTPILIALAAATALSSPAAASTHSRHHSSSSHHERHKSDRHGSSRNNDRHSRHNYSSSAYSRQDYSRERQRSRSAYVAPYRNWSYRRVPVGYHLNSQYYSPRYTISNYGYYGLRAPGRYMRWIRYGNDLLLVDIRYGTVVQVIPGGYYY